MMEEYYRRQYISRINKVIDYIDAHLDEELPLSRLAGLASFSPFHFHRIFSVFVGESPIQYIRRIRLEKAARLLITYRMMPVSDIAIDCGFGSIHVFSRVFRKYFGMSPSRYRRRNSKDDQSNSKNHQTESKDEQVLTDDPEYLRFEPKHTIIMKENIEVKEMPALNLLYCKHVGRFDQIKNAFGKLMRYAGPRGLLKFPATKTVTVYHDDPNITDISKLRQSACITLDEDLKADGEFGTMSLPSAKCVVGHFEIREDGFEKAWNDVCIWMADKGFQPSEGLPYELYHADPEHHPEGKFVLDICVPVKPMD